MADPAAAPLGILLISGTQERAHYAFVLATGAAALGREVVVFATNEGCRALLHDPTSLAGWERDAAIQASGVAGLAELRDAARALDVRLIACDSGLAMAGLEGAALGEGVEIGGVASLLSAAGSGAIVTM